MAKKDETEMASRKSSAKPEEKKEPAPKVPYFKLYRFATGLDWLLIILGWLAAIVVGVSQPVLMIIFGEAVDDFTNAGKFAYCDSNSTAFDIDICAITIRFMTDAEREMLENIDEADSNVIMDMMKENVYWFIGIGLVTWLCGWVQTYCLMWSAQRQITKLRSTFFRSIIRQDIGYFDVNDTGELNTRMFDDVKKVQDSIAEKVGVAIQSLAQFLGGVIIGFVYGWKMALVILAVLPVLAVSGYLWFYVTTAFTKSELDAYAVAGGIAEEVLSGVRTVTAFTAQQEEVKRYTVPLKDAEKAGTKKYSIIGAAIGLLYLTMFCSYGLAFWYGAKLIVEDDYTVGQKLIVFFGVILGAFGLSQLGQNAEYIATGQTAAYTVFQVIDRVPTIDTQSDKGIILSADSVKGKIQLSGVGFTYPARPDQKVLKDVNFEVEAGKTTALCGQSGCGKSTSFHLIKRFYDPDEGVVSLDGTDLKDINVRSLRSLIGVVSQEPILFETSVIENIKMGYLDVSEEAIHEACRQANCYDFIQALPEQWNTYVGEGGATLSGGQKQRIAIARALVRNPKILLLDEATSALDTESEAIVQKALDNASKGRTTIVIAHRLSTIKNADKIIGFQNGAVVEEGNHESLMAKQSGVYFNLCNMQTFDTEEATEVKVRDEKDVKTSMKKSVKKSTKEKEEAVEEKEDENVKDVSYGRLLKSNGPEWPYMVLASFLSAATGAIQPIWALLFADVLQLYGDFNCAYNKEIRNYNESEFDVLNPITNETETFNIDEIRAKEACKLSAFEDKIGFYAGMFCVLGLANFIGFTGSIALFGVSGEKLTTRLRKLSFQKLLSLEIAYFDDPMNSTGALTTRLSADASKVQGATGARINIMVQNIGAFTCGFVIAFYYSWELTLVCLAFVPFIVVTTALMMAIFTDKVDDKEQKAIEDGGKIATEATINIQTVASLGRENTFADKYDANMQIPLVGRGLKIQLYGFMYGASLGIIFMMYAGVFYFAAWLMTSGRLASNEFSDIFKVLFAILFAAMTAGQAGSMAPDYGEAKKAANRIFALLDRETLIDPENEGGIKPDCCKGEVTFESVEFNYPSRPDVKVLKGLSVSVKPGETLALVGQSGCGKSTCIQLLERFYDGTAGNVTVDGHRVQELNVKWLRQQIGLVQQEPILFDKTITENITYGLETENGVSNSAFVGEKSNKIGVEKTTSVEVSVMDAAKEANAFNFIEELPQKFETMCGKKGSQLSGGQKQRVAIARALVRQPKILLLDEATSALDAESERLVQDALNAAQEGRTCILIAHRLSTVINADKIAVIDNGVVTEIGTHQELLDKKGAYFSLINSQL